MKHLVLVFLSVLAALGGCPHAAAQTPARKPNVLFIVSDDLNTDLGCYGHPVVKTPNIDRLAKRGVRFDQAYCQYPVCNPSRASFLSGLRPETIGVMDNTTPPRAHRPDTVFLPQQFRKQGYFVANSGKTFHYVYDDKPSWDISESGNGPKLESLGDLLRPKGGTLPSGISRGKATAGQDLFWGQLDLPDEKMGDGIVARRVAQWMEQSGKAGKPFFLAAGFRKPHLPLNVPKRYFDLYPPEKIAWPPEPPAHVTALPPLARKNATTIAPLPDEQRREAIRAYYAAISFVDAQVGVLLDAMDRLKLWDDTIVVFVSDHGFQLGEHGGLWQKMVLFQESARVPLVVAAPGKKAGAVSQGLVELVDLFPTLTSLCGLPAPPGLEGISFAPLLETPDRPWKKAAFVVVGRQNPKTLGRSVHTARYRYTEWDEGRQGAELYDHQNDPREYRNLAGDPAHAALFADMKRLLQHGPRAALPPGVVPAPSEKTAPARPADPAAGNDAMAALGAQDLAPIAGGASAPSVLPLKKTNYPIPPGAIFVSPDGKAGNDGSRPGAPTSVANALKIVPAGGAIVFRGGSYRGLDRLRPARRVTLQAYPGELPWIKGSIVVEAWTKDGAAQKPLWRHDGWTHKFGPAARIGPEYLDPKYPLAGERDMAFLDGKPLRQVATRQEVGPGAFFVDGAARQLWIGDDPTGRTVEAAVATEAFHFWKNGDADPTGSAVRGLGFCHYGDQGLSFRVADGVLEDNTFCWNGQRGASVYDAPHAMIRGNLFACNSRVGLRVARARRLRIENNRFAWNNVERWRTAWDAAGTKITNLAYGPEDGVIFRSNVVENNLATGLWLDIDANHAVVVRNVARRNQGIGLFFEISDTAILAFNVAEENGTGIMISNSKNARIYNNTLASNATAVVVKETGRTNKYKETIAGTATGEVFVSSGNVLRNNILAGARPGSVNPMLSAHPTRGPSSAMIASSDFNLYWRPPSARAVPVARWSSDGKEDVDFMTVREFSSATGYEKNSLTLDGASGAVPPLFVDAAKGDYHLQPGSPAIGRGEALPDDIARAAGSKAGMPVNLGAF